MAKKFGKKQMVTNGPVSFSLFAAWLGALVYFVQQSVGFGGYLLAILKSFVWPAYLIHAIFKVLRV